MGRNYPEITELGENVERVHSLDIEYSGRTIFIDIGYNYDNNSRVVLAVAKKSRAKRRCIFHTYSMYDDTEVDFQVQVMDIVNGVKDSIDRADAATMANDWYEVERIISADE